MIEINKIYNIDCLDGFKLLEDKSVDFIFTDPPYNVGKKYDGYDDKKSYEDYVEWMEEIIAQCYRVSKRGFAFYISGDLTRLFLNLISNGNLIIILKKAAGICKNNYAHQYHSIISTARPIQRMRNVWDDVRLPGEGYFFKEERYDNPGLTGRKLVEKVLTNFTLENEIVLDPFMGTGTTAHACKLLKRNYIGFEQSLKYCNVANQRVNETEILSD
jgi:DNA modification methylase